jgi:hypothetical protein
LRYGRREPTIDAVWQELEQYGAQAAIVRFHGGAGKPGVIAAVTLGCGSSQGTVGSD